MVGVGDSANRPSGVGRALGSGALLEGGKNKKKEIWRWKESRSPVCRTAAPKNASQVLIFCLLGLDLVVGAGTGPLVVRRAPRALACLYKYL